MLIKVSGQVFGETILAFTQRDGALFECRVDPVAEPDSNVPVPSVLSHHRLLILQSRRLHPDTPHDRQEEQVGDVAGVVAKRLYVDGVRHN